MRTEFLSWDSDFFGFKIYNLIMTRPPIKEDALFMNEVNADLLYITLSNPTKEMIDSCLKSGAILFDKKVTYSKILTEDNMLKTSSLKFESEYHLSVSLESMVYQSGVHSRFRLDPKLRPKFEQMYKIWIEKSLSREMADEVLIAQDENLNSLGFMTLKKRDSCGKITLIAVDEKYRGNKVGSELLSKADEWYRQNKLTNALVVTQLDNIPACRLYEKAGYEINKIDYIFHLWK